MSNAENARKLLAGALELPEQEVDSSTMIGVTQQWDSLAHMRLILALEEAVGSELEMEAVVNIANLSDVETTLANAKA